MKMTTTVLTITGSDGTGGSGVQADIRFISELGGVAASAITSITVQNTLGIQEFHDLPASVVRQQVEAIINDLQPQVVKVGLLRRIDVVEAVADVLRKYRPLHIIYAPVLKSTRGDQLVSPEVHEAIERLLIPLCTVVLEPSDLPLGKRLHGHANQLSSALAVYLSRGEQVDAAMLHARAYLKQLPMGYVEEGNRSSELYNQFLDAVERFW
ncbi:MAG: bifunctional hydroxymethylpyrimidine kinase/phosphomethylpyrimidine kinase, partial [Treponema sp.]|nr:bifunctional hydroxymethylpyrimidine kinase/phosphomethylpyrimidine kinase [Treponema sp.]